jgi:hypothetical protein
MQMSMNGAMAPEVTVASPAAGGAPRSPPHWSPADAAWAATLLAFVPAPVVARLSCVHALIAAPLQRGAQ